jgi:hypothetical protein
MNSSGCTQGLLVFWIVALVGLVVPDAVCAQLIEELDPTELLDGDYWDSTCPVVLAMTPCDSASNGLAVDGMDCADEWIREEFTLAGETSFRDEVRSAGNEGFVRHLEVQYLDYFTEQLVTADTLVTPPGLGIG